MPDVSTHGRPFIQQVRPERVVGSKVVVGLYQLPVACRYCRLCVHTYNPLEICVYETFYIQISCAIIDT